MKTIQELLHKMYFGILSPHPSRPLPMTPEQWRTYWEAQGQPWRREPEIDLQRQAELTQKRAIVPHIEQGIYPFKGMKLSRADIEWLLATHENGRGPVDWRDESQRQRVGVDLRGADLHQVNLRGLPLARLYGGLLWYPKSQETVEQIDQAGISLERADLRETHLEGATLRGAHLEQASLRGVYLQGADLSYAHLEEAGLRDAHLGDAILISSRLEGARLPQAHLEGSDLRRAHLEGAHLRGAHLEGANLQRAFFDGASNLDSVVLSTAKSGSVLLAGTHWSDVDLSLVNWEQVKLLGDESKAQQRKTRDGQQKSREERRSEYEDAVRANRQLAIALQGQGLTEMAVRFAYRAQVLQKQVLWFQMTQHGVKLRQRMQALGAWLFSWFLFLLAGYGYKAGRSLLMYLLVILGFSVLYLRLDSHLSWYEAVVVSMAAFHGRGFSPSTFSPGDPLSIASAFEAFVGLIIEVTFIATLTQRFFNK